MGHLPVRRSVVGLLAPPTYMSKCPSSRYSNKVTHMHLSECECVKVKSAWCLSILKSTCINMCEAEVCSTKVL